MSDQPSEPPQDPQLVFQVQIPESQEQGVYANWLSVWQTAYEFTCDFAVTLPAHPQVDGDGKPVTIVPAKVVSRVKIPPTILFEMIRAMNTAMTNYEAQYGSINSFTGGLPMIPPDDLPPQDGEQS